MGAIGFVMVASAAAVVSCVHAERVVGPDGRGDWWRISCPGGDDACAERAREVCPHEYRIAPIDERAPAGDTRCAQTGYEAEVGLVRSCRGTLLVRCLP